MKTFVCIVLMLVTAQASVIGIDLGGEYMKIAIVRPGKIPIQTVINEQSRRKTPVMVGFNGKERLVGDTAVNNLLRFPRTTLPHFISLIGKPYDEKYLASFERFYFPYDIVNDTARGTFAIKVDENRVFAPEELLAQLFVYARDNAQAFGDIMVKDCVITVPASYTQFERQALLDAAEIAGLKVLSLIQEHTAWALKYGIDGNTDNFDDPQNVVFVDVGSTTARASVVTFSQEPDKDRVNKTIGNLEVKAFAWENQLGGWNFNARLMEMMIKGSKEDPTQKPRSMAKLAKEAERVKQILSANTHIDAQIESLTGGDYDFRMKVTREEFETKSADLFERVLNPVKKALDIAGLKPEEVHAVEIIGGGVRIPQVQTLLKDFFSREKLDMGLNGDEAACLGAGLYAASLSTAFRLRKFGVRDSVLQSVTVELDANTELEESDSSETYSKKTKTIQLFQPMTPVPKRKVMTFRKTEDFSISTHIGNAADVVAKPVRSGLYRFDISGVEAASNKYHNTTSSKVNVSFRISRNGMLELEKAEMVVEMTVQVEEEEPVVKKKKKSKAANTTDADVPKEEASEGEDKAAKQDESADSDDAEEVKPDGEEAGSTEQTDESKQEAEKTAAEDKPPGEEGEEEEPKPKKKVTTQTRVHRLPLTVTAVPLGLEPLSASDIKTASQRLKDLIKFDTEQRERGAALNALETFVYDSKDKLYDENFIKHSTEEEREALSSKLEIDGEWIYEEEGQEANTAMFKEKLSTLNSMRQPVITRMEESELRPEAVEAFRASLKEMSAKGKELASDMPWVTEAERSELHDAIAKAHKWLDDKLSEQESKPAYEMPVFYIQELKTQLEPVEGVLNVLKMKPKPKPKKVEVKANSTDSNSATESDKSASEGADAAAGASGAPEGSGDHHGDDAQHVEEENVGSEEEEEEDERAEEEAANAGEDEVPAGGQEEAAQEEEGDEVGSGHGDLFDRLEL